MHGIFFRSQSRRIAAQQLINSPWILLACAIIFSFSFSGCASVSAENSAADAAAAGLSVVPSVVDFKTVVVGQKNSQTVKITNSSKGSINLKSLRVSGSGFSLSTAQAPVLLAPGGHVNLSVVFAPATVSSETGSLIIAATDLKSPVSVPLSGSGKKAAPGLTVSPSSLSFGSHAVKTSSSQSVTLTNTGNLSISINSITVSNPAFSVSGISKGVTLSADQKLEFQVWYHPTAAGNTSTTISVAGSAGVAPVNLAAVGTATNTSSPTSGTDSPHSVTLTWSDHSSSTKGFHVYRGDAAGGPFKRLDPSKVETTSYKDADVTGGAHYYYVVTAVGDGGPESAYSNEVSVEIPND
jgi:hypothetical protein